MYIHITYIKKKNGRMPPSQKPGEHHNIYILIEHSFVWFKKNGRMIFFLRLICRGRERTGYKEKE